METENKRSHITEDCTDIHYYPYLTQWIVRGAIQCTGWNYKTWIYIDALPTEEEVNAIYPEAIRKF